MNNIQSVAHPVPTSTDHHHLSRHRPFVRQAGTVITPSRRPIQTACIPAAAAPALNKLVRNGVFETYQDLDFDHHTEGKTEGERSSLVVHEDYGKLMPLAQIELMVEEIRATKELAFEVTFDDRGRILLIQKSLERYYVAVKSVLASYSDQYDYSPRVDVFFDAAKELKLLSEDFSFGDPLHFDAASRWRYADLFNELISCIRDQCEKSRFKARLRQHERNANRRLGRALMWEREMFEWRSRHLFLMLCLNYKTSVRHHIRPEDVQRHLQRLLNNRRANRLLSGITGYIWKIEDGKKSGLHVHILIAYSTKRKADVNIARSIGEYWRDVITEGQGSYRNSNSDRQMHREKGHGEGTGQINAVDFARRQALRTNIKYLTKSEQQLKRKNGPKYRTFGMSQPPKKKVAGRPRTEAGRAPYPAGL
ncbi:hypothetical protein WG899_19475 [Paucibacter sp. AS339]|uniref:rolling circle replication-associated protein n=1 Tax=Paucibacter hankyongi TaxID=3133434 RepID=UPI0030B58264